MKKQILFVDDEPKLLDGLRRMLRGLRCDWAMEFVGSGPDALQRLADSPFDVVVTDMRMPGMNGLQLLDEVMKRHPDTVRIILSGQCDRRTVLGAVGLAHQFLAKPCDSETLKSTVGRACMLRDRLASRWHQRLVSCLKTVPSLPSVYRELRAELESPQASIGRVGAILSADMGMTAKIMQLVSSGFLGLPRRVSDVVEAARLLGLDTIRLLVSSAEAFRPFEVDDLTAGWLEVLTQRSLAVARMAGEIAKAETDDTEVAGDALLAGILHDVGMLVLMHHAPRRYLDVLAVSCREGVPLWQLEKEQFGADHAEIGAYLMALWGLPDPMVDGIGSHHCPDSSSHHAFCPLTAVHVADTLVGKEAGGRLGTQTSIDMDYLDRIGLADRLDTWRQIFRATSPETAPRSAMPSLLGTMPSGTLSGNNVVETIPRCTHD